ncbi:MAG: hypothetical protein ABR955_12575 [Verrucomicrobiota bacterium]
MSEIGRVGKNHVEPAIVAVFGVNGVEQFEAVAVVKPEAVGVVAESQNRRSLQSLRMATTVTRWCCLNCAVFVELEVRSLRMATRLQTGSVTLHPITVLADGSHLRWATSFGRRNFRRFGAVRRL